MSDSQGANIPPSSSISDQDIELLTAYMDGELSPAASQIVQKRLATEDNLLDELKRLQTSWDLLDELPDIEADEAFTQSTIQLVVEQSGPSNSTTELLIGSHSAGANETESKHKRRRRFFTLILCTLIACGIAAIAGGVIRYNRTIAELKTLPIAANLSGLRLVKDFKTVESVAEIPGIELLVNEDYSDRILPRVPPQFNLRRKWAEELEYQHSAILFQNARTLQQIEPDEIARLRSLNQQIEQSPLVQKMHSAIGVIGAVLERKSDGERAAVATLDPEDQTAAIRLMVLSDLAGAYRDRLSSDDRLVIKDWAYDILIAGRGAPEQILRTRNSSRLLEFVAYQLIVRNIKPTRAQMENLANNLSELPSYYLNGILRSGSDDMDDAEQTIAMWISSRESITSLSATEMAAIYKRLPPEDQERVRFMNESQAEQFLFRQNRRRN